MRASAADEAVRAEAAGGGQRREGCRGIPER